MSALLARIDLSVANRTKAMDRIIRTIQEEEDRSFSEAAQHLDDLNYNMARRYGLFKLPPRERAPFLRFKLHHETYVAFGEEEAFEHMWNLFDGLSLLFGGDEDLLMLKHGESLDRVVPIHSDRFVWGPKIIPSKNEDYRTIINRWSVRKGIRSE